jgi:predicted P-loop ATPase
VRLLGTTNSVEFMGDITGNRRFWPVRVGTFNVAALRRDRDQLWAEAAAREAEGASIQVWATAPKRAHARTRVRATARKGHLAVTRLLARFACLR